MTWAGLGFCLLLFTLSTRATFADEPEWVYYLDAQGWLWPAQIKESLGKSVLINLLMDGENLEAPREQIYALPAREKGELERIFARARFVMKAINDAGGEAELLPWDKRLVEIKRLPTVKTLAKDLDPDLVLNDADTIGRLIADLEKIGMDWVVVDRSLSRALFPHKTGRVDRLDGFLPCCLWEYVA